jgi:hypothetical protein
VENGILLSPNLLAFFDKNLISFQDYNSILINKSIDKPKLKALGIHEKMSLKVNQALVKYLQMHQEKFYSKEEKIYNL